MRLRLESLAAVALAAGAIGCGSEDPPPDEPIDELARYLPGGDSGLLVFADVTTAREQLGLPADADALAFEILLGRDYDPESPEAQLLESTGVAMPSFGLAPQKGVTEVVPAGTDLNVGAALSQLPKPRPDPFTEAFDGGAIAAAATGSSADGSPGPLTVIRTSQPFDELAEALAKQGYQRDGDVVSKPGAETNEVADAGGGVIVLSSKGASAAEAVAEPGGGLPPALALLEPADEPIAIADVGLAEDCVTGYGGWQDATGSSGVFVIATDGEGERERVELDELKRFTSADLRDPSDEGSTVEVPFRGGGEKGASPLRLLLVSFGRGLYDCG
jgi:hypothetical protein